MVSTRDRIALKGKSRYKYETCGGKHAAERSCIVLELTHVSPCLNVHNSRVLILFWIASKPQCAKMGLQGHTLLLESSRKELAHRNWENSWGV